ncbi:Helicase [Gracilaria domingensis]|nr:Helicase [Gracilaria domingensis]
MSPRTAQDFNKFVVLHNLQKFLSDSSDPVPSAAAAAFFQLLHTRPHRLNVEYTLSAPYISVTLYAVRSDFRPCCLVSGCEPLRFLLWHVFNSSGSADSPCGFEGCSHKCTSKTNDRKQFQLQRVFHEAALKAPTVQPPKLSNPPGNSPLLRLPFDLLLRVACLLPARDHATLSATHSYLRNFLASVIPGMKLQLYPHQISALCRMSQMEEEGITDDMPLIHDFKVIDLQHAVVVADLFDGSIYELDSIPRVQRPRGGLLCDEPGLGKTITTLSHILKTLGREPKAPAQRDTQVVEIGDIKVSTYTEKNSNRYETHDTRRKFMPRIDRLIPSPQKKSPKRQIQRPKYFQTSKGHGVLPICSGTEQIYLSRATLVIVPAVLTEHWMDQIDMHVDMDSLRVLCVHSRWDFPDTALELAVDYDIIIVSFEVIAGLHNEIRQGMPILLKVHFYRVIVDEGHRISSSHVSNFAIGCDKIKTDIRWVMTGTPTPYTPRTDVDHLYSLLTFVRDEAYGLDKDAWRVGIRDPYMRYKTESLDRLSRLLESIMIRADKSLLKYKCRVRNVFLNFSADTAESYNGLIRMGKRNLITSDWFDEDHEQSLLNKRNKGSATTFVSNLRKACCFGGSMEVKFYTNDVVDMLLLLRDEYSHCSRVTEDECFRDPILEEHIDIERGVEDGYDQYYLQNLKRRREWFSQIRSEGRSMICISRENPNRAAGEPRDIGYIVSGKLLKIAKALTGKNGRCSGCREEVHLPFVTPCAHLLCDGCLVRDRTACVVPGCRYPYVMGSNEEPKDLIELQPSIYSSEWRHDWERTESAKMRYLVEKIEELPLVEVWDEGCSQARMVRPKVIIHSESTDHLKLAQLYLKISEMLHEAYIDIVWNERDRSDFVKKCKSPAEYSRKAIKVFAANEDASILLMNSRLGGVGLDLSFVKYIFLLEPLWDSAQEMQIISRAHRIGCVGDILVERLIMRGSIEEAMLMELQSSVNVVEEASAAGVADAKAEKDHQKRRNILLKMRSVRSMAELSRDGQEAGVVARVTELKSFDEVAVIQGKAEDRDGREEWCKEDRAIWEADGVDVKRQVMATRERRAKHRQSVRASKRVGARASEDCLDEELDGGRPKKARRRVRFDDE